MFAIPIPAIIPFPIRGLLLSLIVSFANFLIFLPMHDNGLFGAGNGQDHSNWFWVFVLLNNFAWGLAGVCAWEYVARYALADLPNSLYEKRYKDGKRMDSINSGMGL